MKELITIEKTFSQEDFDEFARISGDENPIHIDAAFSAATGFGRNVAHGLLICTVLRGLFEKLIPKAIQVSQEVKFTAPTFANDVMIYQVKRTEKKHNNIHLDFLVKRASDKVVTCEGSTVMQLRGL